MMYVASFSKEYFHCLCMCMFACLAKTDKSVYVHISMFYEEFMSDQYGELYIYSIQVVLRSSIAKSANCGF